MTNGSITLLTIFIFTVPIWIPTNCGADDVPKPPDPVISNDLPPPLDTPDGIRWFPVRYRDIANQYFFIPDSVALMRGDAVVKSDFPIDFHLSNGQMYRVVSNNGVFTFQGYIPFHPAPSQEDIDKAVKDAVAAIHANDPVATTHKSGWGAFPFIMLFIITLIAYIATWRDLWTRLQTAEADGRAVEKSLQKVKKEYSDAQASIDQFQAEKRALEEKRQELDRRETAITTAERAPAKRVVATAKELDHRSVFIRQQQLEGSYQGGGMVVRGILDPIPTPTGLRDVLFEYELIQQGAFPPTLVVYRNGRVFQRETAFKGTIRSTLQPGKRYGFDFRLLVGKIEVPGTPYFTIDNPPKDAAPVPPPEPPKKMSTAARRRSADEMRKAEYETIDKLEKDPGKRRAAKAAVDQEIVDSFGEAP